MIKAILFDFSRVLLFPVDENYTGSLNDLHKLHSSEQNYSVFNYFKLNLELLAFLKTIQQKIPLYIITSETIQDAQEFAEYIKLFKKIYSAQKLGLSKKESDVYKYIARDLQLELREIVFVDDSEENLAAAQAIGFKTVRYTSNEQITASINDII